MKSKRERGRPAVYPWDKWLNRRSGILVKGEDYQCKTHGMVSQLRNKASERGISMKLVIHDTCIEYTIGNN